jgi:hypothetical protein
MIEAISQAISQDQDSFFIHYFGSFAINNSLRLKLFQTLSKPSTETIQTITDVVVVENSSVKDILFEHDSPLAL